jgi:hypothetical protein
MKKRNLMNDIILAIFLSVLISSCSSISIPKGINDKNVEKPSVNESIIVIGTKPEYAKVIIFEGVIKNGIFRQAFNEAATIADVPENGYLIAKATAGKTLAITVINDTKTSDFFSHYFICGETKTVAFDVPAGKVIYITDLEYPLESKGKNIVYIDNFTGAQKYIDSNFINLKNSLEKHNVNYIPTAKPCELLNHF